MNFIIFNSYLTFSWIIAIFIFSIGLIALFALLTLFKNFDNLPKAIVFPFTGIAGIYQIYFWGLWSAFCVSLVIKFTQKPSVTWDWLYWIMGFIWCVSPIGWLGFKEERLSQSREEVRGVQKGTMLYSLITIIAFLVFAFSPSLMLPPYGWTLKPLGLQNYIADKISDSAEIAEKTRLTVEAFLEAREGVIDASELMRRIPFSKTPRDDYQKAVTLLDESKKDYPDVT